MTLIPTLAAAALLLCGAAHAQTAAAGHAAHHTAAASAQPAASAAAAQTSDGEVRKIDKAQGKLTLKHGPIAHLDMPGMTMVFKVADPALLDKIKPGDKVKFVAANQNGAMTVTAIDLAN